MTASTGRCVCGHHWAEHHPAGCYARLDIERWCPCPAPGDVKPTDSYEHTQDWRERDWLADDSPGAYGRYDPVARLATGLADLKAAGGDDTPAPTAHPQYARDWADRVRKATAEDDTPATTGHWIVDKAGVIVWLDPSGHAVDAVLSDVESVPYNVAVAALSALRTLVRRAEAAPDLVYSARDVEMLTAEAVARAEQADAERDAALDALASAVQDVRRADAAKRQLRRLENTDAF